MVLGGREDPLSKIISPRVIVPVPPASALRVRQGAATAPQAPGAGVTAVTVNVLETAWTLPCVPMIVTTAVFTSLASNPPRSLTVRSMVPPDIKILSCVGDMILADTED